MRVRGLWACCVLRKLTLQAWDTHDLAQFICIRYTNAPVWVIKLCLHISQGLTLSDLTAAYGSADVSAQLTVVAGMVIPPTLSSDVDVRLAALMLTQLVIWLQLYSAAVVHESRLCEVYAALEGIAQRFKLSGWLPLLGIAMLAWGEATLALLVVTLSTLDRYQRFHVTIVKVYKFLLVSCRFVRNRKHL
jgi:hypothetical protein